MELVKASPNWSDNHQGKNSLKEEVNGILAVLFYENSE